MTETLPAAIPTTALRGATPIFTLSDRLRKAREYSGLAQHELAALMGVSRNTVSNAERGSHSVNKPVLIAWAYFTGTDLGWLTNDGQELVTCAPRDSNPEPSGSALDCAECASRDSNPEPTDSDLDGASAQVRPISGRAGRARNRRAAGLRAGIAASTRARTQTERAA